MEPHEREKLQELKAQTKCARNYACVESEIGDLCKGRFRLDLDTLECLDARRAECSFAKPFASTFVCTCPLRKYIARNFEKWIADSAEVILGGKDLPHTDA